MSKKISIHFFCKSAYSWVLWREVVQRNYKIFPVRMDRPIYKRTDSHWGSKIKRNPNGILLGKALELSGGTRRMRRSRDGSHYRGVQKCYVWIGDHSFLLQTLRNSSDGKYEFNLTFAGAASRPSGWFNENRISIRLQNTHFELLQNFNIMSFFALFLFRINGEIQDVQTIYCKNLIFNWAEKYRVITMNFLELLNYLMNYGNHVAIAGIK